MLDQAEIHRKAVSDEVKERREAVEQLGYDFVDLPDKREAWSDLHRLTRDEDRYVRRHAADALGNTFPHVPDKREAWGDLIRLTQDDRRWVVRCWHNIKYWLTGDEDRVVQWGAIVALGTAFQHVPDRGVAWEDLHRLTGDEDDDVRLVVACAIRIVFQYIPDKSKARDDLIRLTVDEDRYVRWHAAGAIETAFQYIPDKTQAWDDLHRLTRNEDRYVRRHAACALGSAFQHVPDKEATWKDLHRLTRDEDSDVRVSANHSLGRASIFKATVAESKGDFESELKNAIEFFERSSNEATYSNPSSFCLPFYRSFYSLTFEKAGAEGEVEKYLSEAKSASKGSENKETLLEAVENLANALSEAHEVTEFDAMKSDLNAYRQYCDRAADLIGDAAEDAPGAAQVLRRGLPIIGERIREIQERAEALCRETRGTPLEDLGLETARSAQELPTQDTLALTMALVDVAGFARDWCEYLPPDKKEDVCEQLKNLTDMGLSEQGAAITRVFECVQENIHIPKIHTVHISGTEQEVIRIAVAQFCFKLKESFPFVLKNKDEVKTKIFSALEIAKRDGANIVCLPELCLCEEWISEIRKRCPDMIVIGGSFYKDDQNTCPVIMKSDAVMPYQPKITPSPFEDGVMGQRMIQGDRIYKYETRFGKFVILICMDFDNLAHFFRGTDIDMIFCPAFNPANKRFWNEAHSHVERTPSYILIANTGLYGGTSIFGQLNNNYLGPV